MGIVERERVGPAARAHPRVSVVIPCLNEAEHIAECVGRAQLTLAEAGLAGEVIVVDNGSEDGSGAIARAAGAFVVEEPRRGYGQAYLAGFKAASGEIIVMIDADLSYDFAEIPRFVAEIEAGAELVMGNRMQGVRPGAMGLLSKIGNPLLSGFLNLLYRTPVGDAHCGLRAFRRDILPMLDLQSTGMELASEMVIRAARRGVRIAELPIELHPRSGRSKLSPFRDGWRHLRLMLVYSPTFVFLVPGTAAVLAGAAITAVVFSQVALLGRLWYVHTLIVGSALIIIGLQVIGLGLCGRAYGVYVLGDHDPWLERMQRRFRLEHGLALGATVAAGGLALGGLVFARWLDRGFGSLAEERLAVLAVTLVVAGIQVFFTSFLLSLIGLRRRS
ncbi:MAG: glycosyltransferase family 2 protein [Thermoleophilia bacterium]